MWTIPPTPEYIHKEGMRSAPESSSLSLSKTATGTAGILRVSGLSWLEQQILGLDLHPALWLLQNANLELNTQIQYFLGGLQDNALDVH